MVVLSTTSIERNLSSDCLMCNGTGKVLDAQNEFYIKLLKWYAESGKRFLERSIKCD